MSGNKSYAARLVLLAGVIGAALGAAPSALSQTSADQNRTPVYACFDTAVALRIQTGLSGGRVRNWVKERFEMGQCLALPPGTRLARSASAMIGTRPVQRIQLEGSRQWLVRPDWALETPAAGGMTQVQRKFLVMVPVTNKLMDYAARHIACLKEVIELNERIEEHNLKVTEERSERDGSEDGISKTVIVMNPSALDERGDRLNKEVAAFNRRCKAYRTLEAATPFVRMMRERGGLDPDLPQSGAA